MAAFSFTNRPPTFPNERQRRERERLDAGQGALRILGFLRFQRLSRCS